MSVNCFGEVNWFQVTANATVVIDWAQTNSIATDENHYETNPILGEYPSTGDVNRYFITSLVLMNTVGYLLPEKYSDYFYITVATMRTATILRNYQIGVRIRF